LAALKTDAVMERQIEYHVQETGNALHATLTLRYSHNGHYDWKTSRYQTYTRVYVPAGSQLIKATGQSQGGIDTGEEFGKQWFGGYLTVNPGQIKELVFEYELPASIRENMATYKNYRLTIQKQPGKQIRALSVDLGFANEIKSYSPRDFYTESSDHKHLHAQGDLKIDRSFLINF